MAQLCPKPISLTTGHSLLQKAIRQIDMYERSYGSISPFAFWPHSPKRNRFFVSNIIAIDPFDERAPQILVEFRQFTIQALRNIQSPIYVYLTAARHSIPSRCR